MTKNIAIKFNKKENTMMWLSINLTCGAIIKFTLKIYTKNQLNNYLKFLKNRQKK